MGYDLTNGLQAGWLMDGLTDATLEDVSVNERDVTDIACDAYGSGPLGYARSFNGTSDRGLISNASASWANWLTGDFTISCWARRTASSGTSTILSLWDNAGNNRSWIFGINQALKLAFLQFSKAGTSADQMIVGIFFNNDTNFHHFLCGREGDTFWIREGATGEIARSELAGYGSLKNSASDLGIGCSHDTNPTNFFNGQLSDLYVWNRALNDEEVTALNGPLSFDNFVNLSAPACTSLSLVNSLVL